METTNLLQEDPIARPQIEVPDPVPGDNQLIDWIRRELQIAMPHVDKFREEYRRARRFFDGKHLSLEDQQKLRAEGRPDNAFNSAQKFVRYVCGVERNAPEALMCLPVDENDEKQGAQAEYATRSYDWANQKAKGDFERSTAFEDLIVGGMGWVDWMITHIRDPRGLPDCARFSPLEAVFPNCDRQNLEGARWRGRETWVDIDEAEARWPGTKFMLAEASPRGKAGTVDRAYPQQRGITEFTIYPGSYAVGAGITAVAGATMPLNNSQLGGEQLNKVRVLQFEWFDDEKGYYFFDPLENNDTWMNESDFFSYRRKLRSYTDQDVKDYTKQTSRTYKRVFLLNQRYQLGEVLKLKRFHLNCMTGSYDEEDKIWYGYFRVLIDPIKFANKFFNQIIEITGRSAKGGGFLYEKGAIAPNQVEQFNENFAKPGTSQEVQPGAIAGKKIMPKPSGELPATAMGLMQFCFQMQGNVTGFSPDQFQGSGANVAGVTMRQKSKSSLILLSKEFDALSRFREDEGYIVLDLLESLADDRLIRIGGHADGEIVKLSREPFTLEYDLFLDDTERDPNLRREYEENVMKLAPTLIRMNMFLPELLDYSRLPFKFKKALKQAIVSAYQQRQEAAKQGVPQGGRSAPVTPEERAAKIQETQARTAKLIAGADRLRTQSKRDEMRTIMEALVKAFQLNIEGEKHNTEKAQAALDIFQQAMGGGQPKAANS